MREKQHIQLNDPIAFIACEVEEPLQVSALTSNYSTTCQLPFVLTVSFSRSVPVRNVLSVRPAIGDAP